MTDDQFVQCLVTALSLESKLGESPIIDQWMQAGPRADGIVYTTIDGTFNLKNVARRMLELQHAGEIPSPGEIEIYRRKGVGLPELHPLTEFVGGEIGVVPDEYLK